MIENNYFIKNYENRIEMIMLFITVRVNSELLFLCFEIDIYTVIIFSDVFLRNQCIKSG